MLDDDLKKAIQAAYSQFLDAKQHQARYGQKLMIAEVARTLGAIKLDADGVRQSLGHLCVVEAGTGTGKTVAYLIPALVIAKVLNKKVVVSTATVALQEQIVLKDLPDIIRHSGLGATYSLAKGRGRYLCLSKLDRILTSSDDDAFIPLYEDESGVIDSHDVALYETMMSRLSESSWDGDKDSWEDEIENTAWQRVTTDHRQCTGRKCSHVRHCAFFQARDALADVDCVVANHDLVLADVALGGGAILPAPEESIYIFDEGHHLPSKALNHFSSHTRYRSSIRWLGQSEGQWPGLVSEFEEASYFVQLAEPLEKKLKFARSRLEEGLPLMQELVDTVDRTENTPRLRFENGEAPKALEILALDVKNAFADLCLLLEKLHKELDHMLNESHPPVPLVDIENLFPVIGSWLARANGNLELWESFTQTKANPAWPIARWITLIEFNDVVEYEVVSSPILASKTLEKQLWSRCCGAVITSATLTALNSFDRFKIHAGTYDDSHYLVAPSPFNHQENGELVVPEKAVEANNALDHTESIIDILPDIIDLNEGSLVLFSSRRQMSDVYDELPSSMRNAILMQGVETKHTLLSKHKKRIDKNQGSILFGLASFAEGVDLPGRYCEHVVIAKIPFAVPDDPIEASLAEWIDAKGGNAFMQVSVPDAAIRLIQSCGRLLRTEKDKGRISILDRRLLTKRYGKLIVDSLPPFKRRF